MALNLFEQLKKDSMDRIDLGYTEVSVDRDSWVYECPTCKALVKDWKGHQEWHEKLSLTANEEKTMDEERDNV